MNKYSIFLLNIFFLIACNSPTTPLQQSKSTPAVAMPQQEKDLRNAIDHHPDSFLLKEDLLQYFRENGNYGQAIAEAEKYLTSDTVNDRLWDIMGTLQFENGDTIRAIQAFEKAVGINSQPEYLLSLGSLYAETGNPRALAIADALLKAKEAKAEVQAIFLKGLYYNCSNDKSKALTFFNQCLAMDYTNMMAYREKAICYYDMGQYTEALKVLEKAITVQNSYAEGYYWMGRCYEKLNDRQSAIDSYNTALEFDNEYPEVKDALARLGIK